MQEIDILIDRGTLVTMDAERRIVTDGYIAIDAGRILEIGKSAALNGKYRHEKPSPRPTAWYCPASSTATATSPACSTGVSSRSRELVRHDL